MENKIQCHCAKKKLRTDGGAVIHFSNVVSKKILNEAPRRKEAEEWTKRRKETTTSAKCKRN